MSLTCDSSKSRPNLLKDATTALAVPLVSFLLDWWLSNTWMGRGEAGFWGIWWCGLLVVVVVVVRVL
jgi:hypothetical protein